LGILDESVSKLKDLQAKELPKVDVVAPVVKKMVVTEVTEA
jgi:hypothetical protein